MVRRHADIRDVEDIVIKLVCLYRAYCYETTKNSNTFCDKTGQAYSLMISGGSNSSVTIGSSWTRGLVIHPVGMYSIPAA